MVLDLDDPIYRSLGRALAKNVLALTPTRNTTPLRASTHPLPPQCASRRLFYAGLFAGERNTLPRGRLVRGLVADQERHHSKRGKQSCLDFDLRRHLPLTQRLQGRRKVGHRVLLVVVSAAIAGVSALVKKTAPKKKEKKQKNTGEESQ